MVCFWASAPTLFLFLSPSVPLRGRAGQRQGLLCSAMLSLQPRHAASHTTTLCGPLSSSIRPSCLSPAYRGRAACIHGPPCTNKRGSTCEARRRSCLPPTRRAPMQRCSVPSIPAALTVRVVLTMTMLTKTRLTASCPGGTDSATSALLDNSGLGSDGPRKAGPVPSMSASHCVCIKHFSIYGSTLISLCKELGADAGHSLHALPPVFFPGCLFAEGLYSARWTCCTRRESQHPKDESGPPISCRRLPTCLS